MRAIVPLEAEPRFRPFPFATPLEGPVRRAVVGEIWRVNGPPLLYAAPPNATKRSICGKYVLVS